MIINLKEIDIFEDLITVIDVFNEGTFKAKFAFTGIIDIKKIEIISFDQYSLN